MDEKRIVNEHSAGKGLDANTYGAGRGPEAGHASIKRSHLLNREIAGARIALCAIVCLMVLLLCVACSRASSSSSSSTAASPSAPSSTTESSAEASASAASTDASSENASASAADTDSKPSIDGFDSSTNKTIEISGVSFEIPSYFEETKDPAIYIVDKGLGSKILNTMSLPADTFTGSADDFNSNKEALANLYIENTTKSDDFALNHDSINREDAQLADQPALAFTFEADYQGLPFFCKGIVFCNEAHKTIGMIELLQSSASSYDYFPDFEKIIASAKILDGDTTSSADSAPASTDAATETEAAGESGEVDPQLKEMLDSYEAFMDEYVEFMKTYQQSDDTMSMFNDYLDYMQRYSDLVTKIENVDTNNLSSADYAYYIEVTSRVSQKLLEVSGI